MTIQQFFKNLSCPEGRIDAVLDTDAFNEIDDQFAIAYMLKCEEKINIRGICAAPFHNGRSSGPADGMNKSYDEILKLLTLAQREDMKAKVYKGSESFMKDEKTPVLSDSARFLAELAKEYSPERPLYIVAIGAITNVASAILLNPEMKENTVIVWLGGNAHHISRNDEFNLRQDVAAARIIFGCGVPFVQLPCRGVVDRFTVSRPELEFWLKGKAPLCDYLAENTIAEAESYAAGKPWTRVIWDVTAVAWLLNRNGVFMSEDIRKSPIPEYDHRYAMADDRPFMKYITHINRDALMEDMIKRLTK